jgi:hypothetical protein
VDPVNCLIHPYPQILTISRQYAEAYRSDHAVNRGELILMDEEVARYAPHQAGSDPVRCERSRIFRLRANSLQATRILLTDLTQETSKPRTLNR